MNERIKQLAEQAWTMVSDEERTRGELYEADKQRERRDQVFAELIVRECVSQMEWQKISPKGEGAYNSALDLAQRNIKERFGVEE